MRAFVALVVLVVFCAAGGSEGANVGGRRALATMGAPKPQECPYPCSKPSHIDPARKALAARALRSLFMLSTSDELWKELKIKDVRHSKNPLARNVFSMLTAGEHCLDDCGNVQAAINNAKGGMLELAKLTSKWADRTYSEAKRWEPIIAVTTSVYHQMKPVVEAALGTLVTLKAHPLVDALEVVWGASTAYTDAILKGKDVAQARKEMLTQGVLGSFSGFFKGAFGVMKHGKLQGPIQKFSALAGKHPDTKNALKAFTSMMRKLSEGPFSAMALTNGLGAMPTAVNEARACARERRGNCLDAALRAYLGKFSDMAISDRLSENKIAMSTFVQTYVFKVFFEDSIKPVIENTR